MNKLITPSRHTGGSRYPDAFEIPGFRVALAIASLPGMTIELCCEFLSQDTSLPRQIFKSSLKLVCPKPQPMPADLVVALVPRKAA